MEEQAVNDPVQQLPQNPLPASKKPNHWIIISIALILVVFIASFFILLLNLQKSSPILLPPISPPPSPITDETANWKTYRNEDFGFEVKYPQNYVVANNDPYGKNYPKFIDKKYTGYSPPGLTIDFDPIHDLELKNYIIQSRVFDIENVNDGIIYIFFTDNQGRKIYSSCEIYDDKEILNICNQILSTFKFTDQESAEGRVCGGPVLEPCPTGYVCQTKTINSGEVSETSGECVKEDQVVCTQEARLCPDGVTYVGRQGPNCEFAKCP